jgi:hypothetical protein
MTWVVRWFEYHHEFCELYEVMKREPSARWVGYNWATLFLGGYKYRDYVQAIM